MNPSMGKIGEDSVQKQAVSAGEPVWVQCDGFRCLAYVNQRGEWRSYSSGARLSDGVTVLSEPIEENF
jgi:hypothetical protein